MIYVNIRGNFGNQLFEYACARRLQEKYKQTICLNVYNLKKYKKEYTFNLMGYKLNDNVIVEEKKKIPIFANSNNIFYRVFRKLFPNFFYEILKHFGIFIWLGNTYKEFPDKEFKNFYLDGYWQSEKYFEDIRDILLEEFVPKNNINESNVEIYKKIEETNSVCVSIRRGDYITNETYRKKFFVCDDKYFDQAFSEIKKYVKQPSFFVCSDDIEWAKENVKIENAEVFFETGKDDVFEKIRMMSKCKNYILSNSSFSWWAQYLSNNDNKTVIAPSIWYANGDKADIYQKNWKLIEVRR